MMLDLAIDVISGSLAYWLASIPTRKMCFRRPNWHHVLVWLRLTIMGLVRRKMLATARLLLCYSRMPQVGRSIIEDGSNLFRTSIMGRLSSDPERFFHELVQSLDGMVELS